MNSSFFYFAYGSNMHPLRLAERTPSCRAVGMARLDRHRLRFHKRSRLADDRSGKCNVLATDDPGDTVHGIVYRIREDERTALDQAEGAGCGYEAVTVTVRMESRLVEAWSYRAHPDWVDERLQPYDWYLALVAHGAVWHGLPEPWCQHLWATPALPDPDRQRAEKWLALAAAAPQTMD